MVAFNDGGGCLNTTIVSQNLLVSLFSSWKSLASAFGKTTPSDERINQLPLCAT